MYAGQLMLNPTLKCLLLSINSVSKRSCRRVTVQTCGDLPTIRPIVEGQPSTVFPRQTVSVPSNVNSYPHLARVDDDHRQCLGGQSSHQR